MEAHPRVFGSTLVQIVEAWRTMLDARDRGKFTRFRYDFVLPWKRARARFDPASCRWFCVWSYGNGQIYGRRRLPARLFLFHHGSECIRASQEHCCRNSSAPEGENLTLLPQRPRLSREEYDACLKPSTDRQTSMKSGFADISVIDEEATPIKDFCVLVDGKAIGPGPRLAMPLAAKDTMIEVFHKDFGDACQEVKVKSNEVSKVVFQFLRRRETVEQSTTKVVVQPPRGAIVVINALANTEVFVDPKKDVPIGKPEDDKRVLKGTGSLKVSNLAADTYVVEFRLPKKKDDESKPTGADSADAPLPSAAAQRWSFTLARPCGSWRVRPDICDQSFRRLASSRRRARGRRSPAAKRTRQTTRGSAFLALTETNQARWRD
jgi:hypothetical protein